MRGFGKARSLRSRMARKRSSASFSSLESESAAVSISASVLMARSVAQAYGFGAGRASVLLPSPRGGGGPRVGKTGIVQGLALRIASSECAELLRDARIVEISMPALIAG